MSTQTNSFIAISLISAYLIKCEKHPEAEVWVRRYVLRGAHAGGATCGGVVPLIGGPQWRPREQNEQQLQRRHGRGDGCWWPGRHCCRGRLRSWSRRSRSQSGCRSKSTTAGAAARAAILREADAFSGATGQRKRRQQRDGRWSCSAAVHDVQLPEHVQSKGQPHAGQLWSTQIARRGALPLWPSMVGLSSFQHLHFLCR